LSCVRHDCVTIVLGAAPGTGLPIACIFATTSGGSCIPDIVFTAVFCHNPIFTGGSAGATVAACCPCAVTEPANTTITKRNSLFISSPFIFEKIRGPVIPSVSSQLAPKERANLFRVPSSGLTVSQRNAVLL
jgi:hypothetical protein